MLRITSDGRTVKTMQRTNDVANERVREIENSKLAMNSDSTRVKSSSYHVGIVV